jgi:hypothetical protein
LLASIYIYRLAGIPVADGPTVDIRIVTRHTSPTWKNEAMLARLTKYQELLRFS